MNASRVIATICAVVLLLTCQLLQAREAFNGATPASDWAPIELTLTDSRYSLASLDHSSGFVPAPKHLILKDAFDRPPESKDFGLDPNFREHSRYWLYTHLQNNTDNRDRIIGCWHRRKVSN